MNSTKNPRCFWATQTWRFTMRPRHTAPEVVRSLDDVHTCGRFFCRGYIIASVSVGRFIYIHSMFFFIHHVFMYRIYVDLWRRLYFSFDWGWWNCFRNCVLSCTAADKYYVFALNSLPVNPIPQTLPIWRITPLSKCLVKGYTKPFITKPYSGDLLPMILNHLHVMGWSSR